jgi:hypothetical protein
MGRKINPVSDADAKKSLAIIKKYLNENGLGKRPLHFKHYLLRNFQVGDYAMRVIYHDSKTILTNKLYPIVSSFSERRRIGNSIFAGRTYFIVLDEKGEEYRVDTTNVGQHWVYFEKKEVEKKIKLSVPDDIVEYNIKLANEITRRIKRKKETRYW